ncbi:hypothetical protein DIPPA_16818 [Diplonema papillatum]|nr:hypothetical protein DIPPA_16818 [Diplonema papillatum]
MQLIRAAWLAVPVVVGLTLLIVWLATGAAEPWGPGLPFVVFLPVWAAVAAKLWETDAEAGGKSWVPGNGLLDDDGLISVFPTQQGRPQLGSPLRSQKAV